MSFYDYECENCHEIKVVQHSIKKNPRIKCDYCGEKARRLIGIVNTQFFGNGFYCNDYKKEGNGN